MSKIDNISKVIRLRKLMRGCGLESFSVLQEKDSGPYTFEADAASQLAIQAALDCLDKMQLMTCKARVKWVNPFTINVKVNVRCRNAFAGFHDLVSFESREKIKAKYRKAIRSK